MNSTIDQIIWAAIYITQKFEIIIYFYAHQGCIYSIKNTAKTVKLWNIITILNNCFLL